MPGDCGLSPNLGQRRARPARGGGGPGKRLRRSGAAMNQRFRAHTGHLEMARELLDGETGLGLR